MTYEAMRLSGPADPRRACDGDNSYGALVMVHAENFECLTWLTETLEAAGKTEPKYHATSRPMAVEREATHRAITLCGDCRDADPDRACVRARGGRRDPPRKDARPEHPGGNLPAISAAHRSRPRCCRISKARSACAARRRATRRARRCSGRASRTDCSTSCRPTMRLIASTARARSCMACGRRFGRWPTACRASRRARRSCSRKASGKGRIGLERFVALNSTNAARIYGLYPRKGTIAVGVRRRHRDLGPGAEGDDPQREPAS